MLDDLIAQLTARTFDLSLPRCELRQCGVSSPLIYSGAGFVRQESDGRLVLRMFAAKEVDEGARLAHIFSNSFIPGVLIPDTDYYDFTATDQGGHTWRAERQSIEEIFGVGHEIHVQLRWLEKIEDIGKPGDAVGQGWFIPGSFELPWHIQTRTERKMSVDRFEFEDSAFAWKAHKAEAGLNLHLAVKDPSLELHAKRFLHALGMLLGQILEPLVSYQVGDGRFITRIHPLPSTTPARLTGPMELQLYEHHDAHRFLACCMHRADRQYPVPTDQFLILYRFWYRVARARSTDIENSSLVLSVAIEGVLKALFHSRYDTDAEFGLLLQAGMPAIEKLAAHPRVRVLLLKSLENAALPKPKDTMQRLKEQGVLTQEHIKAWKDLRHAGAHGALLEDDKGKFQRQLDRYFCCLDLFYRMVFVAVGYRGQYVDRSKPGWPKSTFPTLTTGIVPLSTGIAR